MYWVSIVYLELQQALGIKLELEETEKLASQDTVFLVSLQLSGALCALTYGLWTEMIHTKLIL